ILNCLWRREDRPPCVVKPNYSLKGEVTDTLVLEIPSASEEHVGTYQCWTILSGPTDRVEETTQSQNTTVSGEQNGEGDGDTREGKGDTREGEGDTREGGGDTREGGGDTREGGGDTREGGGDTREGGGDTREGEGDTREGEGDTREDSYTGPAHKEHLRSWRFLLEQKADVESRDNNERTALHLACVGLQREDNGHVSDDGNEVKETESTPLVSEDRHQNVVKKLLAYSADVNVTDYNGQTPLHLACMNNNEAIVKLLLENTGVKPDPRDKVDRTPLHYACDGRSKSIVRKLIEYESELSPKSEGRTSLHSFSKHDALVQILNRDARFEIKAEEDKDKPTPPDLVCERGNENIVRMLIEHRSDLTAADFVGCTPLHLACFTNNEATVMTLLSDTHVEINAKDNDERTPLHLACQEGSENIVRMLINRGSDLRAVGKDGRTPANLARDCGRPDIATIIAAAMKR
ncbi:hypothetical protein BaRGS_00035023, partial [Batillaria attramentaria]